MKTEFDNTENEALNKTDVSKRLYLDDISIELYSNDSDEDYRIDINISNINREAILNKEQAINLYEYLRASLNINKIFSIGEKIKIKRYIHGHEFNINEEVTIIDFDGDQTASWLCTNGIQKWWISEEEANVC
jgi:hypothetical protein